MVPRQKAASFSGQWGESSAPRFTPRSSDYGQPRKSLFPHEEKPRPTVTPVARNLKRVSSVAPSAGSSGGTAAALQVGQLIQHDRFGIGEVKKVEGSGDNAKATIEFRNAGTKQLLLRFARFKVIS